MYNRFVNGAKGLDQCPNIDMWMGLLENVQVGRHVFTRLLTPNQAGCLYICKCQRPQKTNISYQVSVSLLLVSVMLVLTICFEGVGY